MQAELSPTWLLAVDTNPDAFQMDSEPDHSDDMKTTQDLAKSDSGGVEDAEGDQKVDEYEEITVDASILKSCSDVCAEEGKACDAMYNHFIFGPIASVHNYTEDVILSTNECDDIPDKTTSAFGGGEKELINYVCYCK